MTQNDVTITYSFLTLLKLNQSTEFVQCNNLSCTTINLTFLKKIMTKSSFDQLQESLSEFLNQNNLQNLENPLNRLLQSKLKELNFVSFEAFETQKKVLERAQEKLKLLEKRVNELEQENVAK